MQQRSPVSVLRSAWLPMLAGLCAALLGAGLLGTPAPALGHADLVVSSPAANVSLIESPDTLELTFTEPVDAATISIDLLDARQQTVDGVGAVELAEDGTTARVSLPDLEPGVYTVSYGVVSTVDGHATTGFFAFAVDPTGAQAPPTEPPVSTSPSVDGWAVAARWVALAGLLLAFGSILIWRFAARRALSEQDRAGELGPPWVLIAGAAACGLVGVSAHLALAARSIGTAGFPLDLAAPFGWTPFAIAMRVTTLATLLTIALAASAILLRRSRSTTSATDQRFAMTAAVALAAALGGMSAAGHAASIGGPAFAAIDWLHLAAVAAWLGGLPAAFVLANRRGTQRAATFRQILRHHGPLALLAAPVVVLTGVANSPLVLGTDRALVASGYGNLLIAKALLVSVALGIGAVNHLFLRGRGRANLSFLVSAEVGIAALALMAAATMVTIQPASVRGPELISPPLTTAHLYGNAGPTRIHASVSLPAPGNQLYQVTVADLETGAPRADVQAVFLTFTPPKTANLPPQRVELASTELATLYHASGAYTPVVGEWGLDVTVRREGARDESIAFALPVDVIGAPQLAPPPDTGIGVPAPLGVLWSILPDGAAGWLPSAAALVAALALGGIAASTAGWMGYVRIGLLTFATVTALGAGSRELVLSANAPTPAELAIANPMPADAESMARGERLYLANCASCHGTSGDGDGPVSVIPDAGSLRAVLPHTPDAELAYRIRNGLAGTSMPAFAATLTESEQWDLVNYLRHAWVTP